MTDKIKRCIKPPSHPNLQSGWGCCNCRTFNGDQRQECKTCQHKRCDSNPANQVS
jgi:hypothetical protein